MKTRFSLSPFLLGFIFLLNFPLTEIKSQSDFPQSWVGNWKGDLEIFNAKGKVQAVGMELLIQPIDSNTYSWTIIYVADTVRDVRPYFLKIKDQSKGWYEIDEGNSIFLDAYLLGGVLYEQFEVMGSSLLTRTERSGEHLIFEIIAGISEPVRITGGTWQGEEEIPEVKSFFLSNYQKAILKKY